MYHSITFGDKNTWNDWKIVPKERPYFAPPAVKTTYVDIPGASSKLDFSEALTGYPLYENRTGTIEFYILNELDDVKRYWEDILSEIQNYLHNKKLKAILEDDPLYYYEGRFSVDSYQPGNSASDPRSTITIAYDVGPYKWNIEDSIDSEWLWDLFDFEKDVIQSGFFRDIPINTTYKEIDLSDRRLIGYAPFFITAIVSANGNGAYVKFENSDLNINIGETQINDGTTELHRFVVYGTTSKFYVRTRSGTGTISVQFREGRL